MKNFNSIIKKSKLTILALGFTAIITAIGCNKDVEANPEIQTYGWASMDDNAGNWKPILLANADEVSVAAPNSPTSSAYLTDLAALKTASVQVTAEQESAIKYWSGNATVRWNEIARNLVAKYNLPPAANSDGTYSLPNAATPNLYPYFPFSNPPYAARAYAYWSAAQFDALIVAWRAKYKYNRPAPYETDKTITTRLTKTALPTYPSEDAVIAAVSVDILSALFPNEVNFLKKKAEEHRQTRLWAGMNTADDLAAGEVIGKAVAAKFIARSKTDGMKNAAAGQAICDSLANSAQTRFNWQWKSMESPARIPMLAYFGKVTPWCLPNVATVRPVAPPALTSSEFQKNADEVKKYCDKPTSETERIANFWSDGAGTYTPPGHWNKIASDQILATKMNPIRTARTLAYVNMALADAGISCWDTKYFYYYPRPSQAIPGLKSILGLPNFPSYTSGHSTFSAAAATVLGYIFPTQSAEFERMAKEASESRIYGVIHYRFDCEVGLDVGKKIGNYTSAVGQKDGSN